MGYSYYAAKSQNESLTQQILSGDKKTLSLPPSAQKRARDGELQWLNSGQAFMSGYEGGGDWICVERCAELEKENEEFELAFIYSGSEDRITRRLIWDIASTYALRNMVLPSDIELDVPTVPFASFSLYLFHGAGLSGDMGRMQIQWVAQRFVRYDLDEIMQRANDALRIFTIGIDPQPTV
jgi:hypothetical protein